MTGLVGVEPADRSLFITRNLKRNKWVFTSISNLNDVNRVRSAGHHGDV